MFPLQPRILVPVGGLMVGNSMTATVLAARRLVEELRDRRPEVEARLALGQPSQVAARPYLRAALRSALTPQIETTSVLHRGVVIRVACAGDLHDLCGVLTRFPRVTVAMLWLRFSSRPC